jgi:hypothetical protein
VIADVGVVPLEERAPALAGVGIAFAWMRCAAPTIRECRLATSSVGAG